MVAIFTGIKYELKFTIIIITGKNGSSQYFLNLKSDAIIAALTGIGWCCCDERERGPLQRTEIPQCQAVRIQVLACTVHTQHALQASAKHTAAVECFFAVRIAV